MERRIALFGYTGAGKSTTANIILGETTFKANARARCVTFKTESATTVINGRQVVVVDTPGVFDTRRGNDESLREITRCVAVSAPGPHALIMVVPGGNRVTDIIQKSADILIDAFGDNALRHMIVLFTRLDDIEYDDDSIDDFVNSLPDGMTRVLEKCGNRYLAFNNRAKEDVKQAQVRELMDMVDNVVESNGGRPYTSEAFEAVEELITTERRNVSREIIRREIESDTGESGGLLVGAEKRVITAVRASVGASKIGGSIGGFVGGAPGAAVGEAVGAAVGAGAYAVYSLVRGTFS